MTANLIGLLIAAVVAFVAWALLDGLFSEQASVAKRLKSLSEAERRQADDIEPLLTPFRQRVLRPTGQTVAGLARGVMPKEYRERLEHRVGTAGNPAGITAEGMLALKIISVVAVFMLAGWFAFLTWTNGAAAIALSLVAALLGWFIPDMWLNSRISHRQELIRRELPDMLDMLMIAVEAGLGFDAAVTRYIRVRSGPLAEEFATELNEVQAGMSRREALRRLADRCGVFELGTFCMAMVQADVFGVSVGNVLRTQASEMRLKRRQHAEELAQKVPAKMVFPLVFCILPATLIVLAAPAVISIGRLFAGLGG